MIAAKRNAASGMAENIFMPLVVIVTVIGLCTRQKWFDTTHNLSSKIERSVRCLSNSTLVCPGSISVQRSAGVRQKSKLQLAHKNTVPIRLKIGSKKW